MNIVQKNVFIFKLINGAEIIAEVSDTSSDAYFKIRNPLQIIPNPKTGCDCIPYILGTDFPTESYQDLHKSAVCMSNVAPIPELVTAYVYTVDPPPELYVPETPKIIVP